MLLKTAFDIDGVFCHTWETIIEILNDKGYDVTEDDLVGFDLRSYLPIPVEDINDAITISLSREYMPHKTIDPHAIMCVRNLYKMTGKTIPFVTSRKNPEDTVYFLENYIVRDQFPYHVEHGSWDDGMTTPIRKLKQLINLKCEAMVEDAPETLQLLSDYGFICMLRDRPYNQYATWALRFTDWREVYNVALRIESYVGGNKRVSG
jgi:uncharacterized HAD superfamily protein